MKKVLIVFGTRPEAIKMSPLVKKFLENSNEFVTKICVTAQHRQMLDQVLELFEIVPHYDLDIMREKQDLFDVTTKVLLGLKDVIRQFKPDIVFVHGDTTTSFAAALASFYENIKIAHIEAGLRTYNLNAPWPEEANRQLTSRLANFNFAPTIQAKNNLLSEGIASESIIITGNTVIDALNWVINNKSNDKKEILNKIKCAGYSINSREIILITGHRRENFGQGFKNICSAIKEIAQKYSNLDLVYPVHLNPNVRQTVFNFLDGIPNIFLINPLDYQPFSYLMSISKIILTDSGGIQEEAPSLGKPVLVMRDTTERPEAVKAGTVKLVGTNILKIVKEVSALIDDKVKYKKMSQAHNPYGDGNACQRIVNFFRE